MAGIDIFSSDAFSTFELTTALDNVEHKPQWLGQLGIFEPKPVRTESVAVERRGNALSLVPTTDRGAPLPQRERDDRDIRDFRTVRVAKGDVLRASELQNIRAFGTTSELQQVQEETLRRLMALRNDIDLTHEHMRLGAVQGIVLDADGQSVIRNWYTEWGIAQPAEIDFDLDAANPASGVVRTKCNQVVRAMVRAAEGSWVPGVTQAYALCGDTFWDQLVAHSEVRQTYLNQVAAQELRNDVGQAFGILRYGNITFLNYQGTDDNSKVAIESTKCKFFPVGARDVFQWAMSPGESFDWVNTPGQPFYAIQVPDEKRNAFVELEVYSYPLYICTKPKMLQRARNS